MKYVLEFTPNQLADLVCNSVGYKLPNGYLEYKLETKVEGKEVVKFIFEFKAK